ncbi:hypothetical protein [Micromonospora psammae]|uniref:hypothetical protein n=1 Tax=Micromonospora sp. CPCC 205556 TaxID=3122398 RepID=UPI002FF0E1EC
MIFFEETDTPAEEPPPRPTWWYALTNAGALGAMIAVTVAGIVLLGVALVYHRVILFWLLAAAHSVSELW